MHTLLKYTLCILAVGGALSAWGQEAKKPAASEPEKAAAVDTLSVKGRIFDGTTSEPLVNVQIASPDMLKAVVSNPNGTFRVRVTNPRAQFTFSKRGYQTQTVNLYGRDSLVIYLTPTASTISETGYMTPLGIEPMALRTGSESAINRDALSEAAMATSDALAGRLAGLRVLNKSGMPGEGSFVNLHGVRSLLGQNSPLIVIDGVPYLPNTGMSNAVSGFSSDIFSTINLNEIERITLLKGADALPYGSMAANGVLMIETERGADNQTIVEVQTTQGVGMIAKQLPMLDNIGFRKYISDIASTQYDNEAAIHEIFPFLAPEMSYEDQVRYGFNTNWQDEIYRPAFTSDNMIKVKGGDAIAKFMVTAGYQYTDAIVDGASRDKFYTRGNADVGFSNKLNAFASLAFSYTELNLQEQGMVPQTNPLLAAYTASPLTGVFEVEENTGRILSDFAKVDPNIGVSNPAAIGSEILGNDKVFDILVNLGINYNINDYLKASIGFGINYNYIKDRVFIGGKTSGAIAPLMGGQALNTVRDGSSESKNYYGRATLSYDRTFAHAHRLQLVGGWQLFASRLESSYGTGINTNNDRNQSLGNTAAAQGRDMGGSSDIWNWMNAYFTAGYSYKDQLFVNGSVMVDASSAYGPASDRAFFFPAAKVGWKLSNSSFLRNSFWLSNLMVRAEYSINPNSRYSSYYGHPYYEQTTVREVSALRRGGIPNRFIGPERVTNVDLGVDFAIRGDRFTMSVDLFEEHTRDMIVEDGASPLYGFGAIYRNSGAIRTRGIDVSLSAQLLSGGFKWRVGGNITHYKSRIMSLGRHNEQFITLDKDNGVIVINRVGESPYSFYGHEAGPVYATSAQARADKLSTVSGYQFTGGDIAFRDQNGDGVISNDDKVLLGSADPDFFGGFYSRMSYKNFSLTMNFTYSYGNEIYNGVRRFTESGSKFTNQAASMSRRWVTEGQQTDIPRVAFGDPAGNNRFSSRWIEDGSYLKLKELTLAYDLNRPWLIFTAMRVYFTAENLLTFTSYTGSDPELSYSYDLAMQGLDLGKLPVPRVFKLGLILNF